MIYIIDMRKHSKLLFFIGLTVGLGSQAFAAHTAGELLEGYLKNNLSIQNLSAEAQKQLLDRESTYLSNGMSFNISTGTVSITAGGTDGTFMTFSPTATFSYPEWSNLGVSAGTKIQIGGAESSKGISDSSIKVSADIISGNMETRQIALLRADRKVIEANRELENSFLSTEKQFYQELMALYRLGLEVIKSQKTLYEDELSFDTIKAQGFSTTSSKYRTASLKVTTSRRSVETAQHKLEREVKLFANDCGIEYTETNPMDFLPTSIPSVEAVDVLSFDAESYVQLERALWNQKINQMTRDASKNITLTGNAGYTFGNSRTKSDSIDMGTNFTWNKNGLTASAGVSLPIGADTFTPVYTFGVSVNPTAFRQADITDEQTQLSIKQEDIEVQKARSAYESAVVNQQTNLADIEWNRKSNKESYEMYASLASDLLSWYRRGIIAESEYRSAYVNEENYRVQMIINDIELIIYNDETGLLFCRDEGVKNEEENE